MSDKIYLLKEILDMGYTPVGWFICPYCHCYYYICHLERTKEAGPDHRLFRAGPADIFAAVTRYIPALTPEG